MCRQKKKRKEKQNKSQKERKQERTQALSTGLLRRVDMKADTNVWKKHTAFVFSTEILAALQIRRPELISSPPWET
jgi:hypothetical protein